MPRHAFARFSKRSAPYSRPVRRIGSYRPRVTRSRTMDEEAIVTAVAAARTAVPRSLSAGARGMSTNVHKFARWRESVAIPCNFGASGLSFGSMEFQFAQIVQSAELSVLYDSYRIDKVELWFDYSPDVQAIGPGSNMGAHAYPKLWIKRDYNDSNAPGTLDEMEQSNQTQVLRFTDASPTLGPYMLTPAAQVSAFNAAAGTDATVAVWRPWLRTAHPTIEHYGVKWAAQGIPSINLGAITVRVRFHVTMKNVR